MSDRDEQLLERWRDGDDTAFDALFTRHYAQVYRVLYGLFGSHEDAEDTAQETFLALYRRPPDREQGAGLAAWLGRVALNRGYNRIRAGRRAETRLERAWEPPATVDPQSEALRADERARVRDALAALPDRQARLLLLRHAGYAYAEIAEALEIAPGSVGTLLIRAERAFRAAYERLEPVHDA